jgi:hypothetical protein
MAMHENNEPIELHCDPLALHQEATAMVVRAKSAVKDDFRARGKFRIEHRNKDGKLLGIYEVPNGIVDVGLNHILETEFHSGSQVTTWYIGLIDNASFSALAAADTMASHAGWVESADYTEANRPTWTAGAAAARTITNAVTVDFSINATKTIKGIFITSNNTKSGTTGTLWSTAAFGSTVSVNNGDTLKVTYTLSG